MKLIYKSSYDRGLFYLLAMWPEIKKAVPEATLDIFYGWNLFDLDKNPDPNRLVWKNMMEGLMKQEGITHHGRVSKKALDEATSKCDIWAYPTDFGETNCITALDSQKLGCVPVTVAYAGLLDTVYSGVMIEGDMSQKEVQEKWLKALLDLWNDKKRLAEEKKKGIEGAKDFAWSRIARLWMDHF